jgi:hypothetical protein
VGTLSRVPKLLTGPDPILPVPNVQLSVACSSTNGQIDEETTRGPSLKPFGRYKGFHPTAGSHADTSDTLCILQRQQAAQEYLYVNPRRARRYTPPLPPSSSFLRESL